MYSLDLFLSQFGTSLLFHAQFWLLLLDLHTDFSGGRSGGLVFPSLETFVTVAIHTVKGFGIVIKAKVDYFRDALVSSMIQWMWAVWALSPLPSLKPASTSGSSWFTDCWSLACRILSTTSLACEMSAIVWWFEHSLALPFFGIGLKADLFQSCGHCWVFQIGILSAALSQLHLLGFEIAQLEFHHLH